MWHDGGKERCLQDFGGKTSDKETTLNAEIYMRNNIETDLKEIKEATWTGYICLDTGTSGEVL
jgi:hypothetical protein